MMMKYRTHNGEIGGYFDLAEIVLWKRGATDPHLMIDKNGDVRKPPKRTKPVRKKTKESHRYKANNRMAGPDPLSKWLFAITENYINSLHKLITWDYQ